MRHVLSFCALMAAGQAQAQTTHYVFVSDYIFDPVISNVTEGDRVRWVFLGPSALSATAAAGQVDSFDSGLQLNGVFFEYQFYIPGTINYYDVTFGSDDGGGLVSGMSGTIVVAAMPIDTDLDGLTDYDEINVYGTDPANADTDGGGVDDGTEVLINMTDPLDPTDDFPPLVLIGPSPGLALQTNDFDVSGAMPSGDVGFFRSDDTSGTTQVRTCPVGVVLDMVAPLYMGRATADANGDATKSKPVPANGTGVNWRFQAVDIDTCRVSNYTEHTF